MSDSITNIIIEEHGYQYLSILGRGGFGIVYEVVETLSGQKFAIKRLHTRNTEDQEFILREIRAIAEFNHPGIINYKNSFREDDALFLVMEYCPNGSLYDRIRRHGRLSPDQAVKLFLSLTETMKYLHDFNIVHHDLKPPNILFNRQKEPVISDFGCANSTDGTIFYYAPEQFNDDSTYLDPRTDIYSLGITLMECVLGYNPFFSLTLSEIILAIKSQNLPIANLEHWMQEIILKACHFDPSARFQSMAEFNKALREKDI